MSLFNLLDALNLCLSFLTLMQYLQPVVRDSLSIQCKGNDIKP